MELNTKVDQVVVQSVEDIITDDGCNTTVL